MFYRFKNGIFIESSSFEQAKSDLINEISNEKEDTARWHKCTCLGFNHRFSCPENFINKGVIIDKNGEDNIPF